MNAVQQPPCRPRVTRRSRFGFSATRLDWQRTRNSPPSHHIARRDVSMVCTRAPVSASRFVEIAVRTDSWTVAAGVGRVVFMAAIFCAPARAVHVQISEKRT